MKGSHDKMVITAEYFNEQVCEFIDLCGRRSFWEADPKIREAAIKALGYVYLRTEEAESWRFQVAIENYTRRDFLAAFITNPGGIR